MSDALTAATMAEQHAAELETCLSEAGALDKEAQAHLEALTARAQQARMKAEQDAAARCLHLSGSFHRRTGVPTCDACGKPLEALL